MVTRDSDEVAEQPPRALPPKLDEEEIKRRFTHHVPSDRRRPIHDEARARFLGVALELATLLPDCRERSLAFTALEEASFWAHAAVARNVE